MIILTPDDIIATIESATGAFSVRTIIEGYTGMIGGLELVKTI